MAFEKKTNSQDVFIREALIAALGTLSNLVKITQNKDNVEEEVDVPFHINLGIGSSDRFYHDFYLNDNDCPKKIQHNYDKLPRVAVTPNGITLNASESTSPWGKGQVEDVQDGRVVKSDSFIHMLPIEIDLEFELKCDTLIEMFKIWQEIIDYTLFSSLPFQFTHKKLNIESTITIEVPSYEKTFTFTPDEMKTDILSMVFTGKIITQYPSIKDKYFDYLNLKTSVTPVNKE